MESVLKIRVASGCDENIRLERIKTTARDVNEVMQRIDSIKDCIVRLVEQQTAA